MTCDEIEGHFKQVLREVQKDTGHPNARIEDDTIPLKDLEDFDSLSALDAEARLAAILGPNLGTVPFKSPTDGHEMSVREIVDHLCKRLAPPKKAK